MESVFVIYESIISSIKGKVSKDGHLHLSFILWIVTLKCLVCNSLMTSPGLLAQVVHAVPKDLLEGHHAEVQTVGIPHACVTSLNNV